MVNVHVHGTESIARRDPRHDDDKLQVESAEIYVRWRMKTHARNLGRLWVALKIQPSWSLAFLPVIPNAPCLLTS